MPETIAQHLSVILVQPQMGENIGAAARIMSNFGLRDLRIVAPRDGWPNPKAGETARNAKFIVDSARIYPTLEAASEDVHYLFASTARPREMVKPCFTPREASAEYSKKSQQNIACGLVFGPERSGLTNEDVSFCDAIVTIPVSEDHPSLNIAQAVAIMCYECAVVFQPKVENFPEKEPLATKGEIANFFTHLETALDNAQFFKVPEKRERMVMNIRNMFLRADLTAQDVRTLRGILNSLENRT